MMNTLVGPLGSSNSVIIQLWLTLLTCTRIRRMKSNEWTEGLMNGWINTRSWMEGWMKNDWIIQLWTDGWTDGWIDEWMNIRTDGKKWIDVFMNKYMNGYM